MTQLQQQEPAAGAAKPAAMRVEGRVLAGALEMRHDGNGRGYCIVARADIPAAAILLQARRGLPPLWTRTASVTI